MYQITIGADRGLKGWINILSVKLKSLVGDDGVVVSEVCGDRILLGVGKESESVATEIRSVLSEFYLKDVKEEYLYSNICGYTDNDYLIRIYIKILNLFNIDDEKDILSKQMCLYSNFSLDGFYRFRLKRLKEKWDDLLTLTYHNMDLIRDEHSLKLLIRNLITCITPIIEVATVERTKGSYSVILDEKRENFFYCEEEVVYQLINNMPKKVIISKKNSNILIAERIKEVFGESFVQFL